MYLKVLYKPKYQWGLSKASQRSKGLYLNTWMAWKSLQESWRSRSRKEKNSPDNVWWCDCWCDQQSLISHWAIYLSYLFIFLAVYLFLWFSSHSHTSNCQRIKIKQDTLFYHEDSKQTTAPAVATNDSSRLPWI